MVLLAAGIMLKNISLREMQGIVNKNLSKFTFSKKLGQMFQNRMLQNTKLNVKILKTLTITLKRHVLK